LAALLRLARLALVLLAAALLTPLLTALALLAALALAALLSLLAALLSGTVLLISHGKVSALVDRGCAPTSEPLGVGLVPHGRN
jgi:hypothetical protein